MEASTVVYMREFQVGPIKAAFDVLKMDRKHKRPVYMHITHNIKGMCNVYVRVQPYRLFFDIWHI